MSLPLTKQKCAPCEKGVLPLKREAAKILCEQTPDWTIDAPSKELFRTFQFGNFVTAVAFINAIATLAEEENHHPDIHLHNYKQVTVTLSTHAIGGLSENDFILAAKIDAISRTK